MNQTMIRNRPLPVFSALALAGVLLVSGAVRAGVPGGPTQGSRVTDVVTDLLNGSWLYEYTVFNEGAPGFLPDREGTVIPIIRDWELPWFGDAGIVESSIFQPQGWDYAIEDIGTSNPATGWDGSAVWQNPADRLYGGPNSPFTNVTQVLHWYTNEALIWGIYPEQGEGEFGFIADFGPIGAPYQASWRILPVETGDPALPDGSSALPVGPASPALAGQLPEPDTVALLGAAILGWPIYRRWRRR